MAHIVFWRVPSLYLWIMQLRSGNSDMIISFWNSCVDGLMWHRIWELPHTYLNKTNNIKVKSIYCKLFYKCYPSNYFLVNRFNCDIDLCCTFCGLQPFFFQLFCSYSASFWLDFGSFVKDHIMHSFQLCFENITFVFNTLTHSLTHTQRRNIKLWGKHDHPVR